MPRLRVRSRISKPHASVQLLKCEAGTWPPRQVHSHALCPGLQRCVDKFCVPVCMRACILGGMLAGANSLLSQAEAERHVEHAGHEAAQQHRTRPHSYHAPGAVHASGLERTLTPSLRPATPSLCKCTRWPQSQCPCSCAGSPAPCIASHSGHDAPSHKTLSTHSPKGDCPGLLAGSRARRSKISGSLGV